MIVRTLEEHLEELCPNCMTVHGSDWNPEFEHFTCYKTQTCDSCGYVLFKKLNFSTDGSVLM